MIISAFFHQGFHLVAVRLGISQLETLCPLRIIYFFPLFISVEFFLIHLLLLNESTDFLEKKAITDIIKLMNS
jgi:thiosulfate reductase cytochrome b subunit